VNVPLLDLAALHARRRTEIESAIARVLDHQQFILGTEVASLEKELCAWLGVPDWRGAGTSSGTAALVLAQRLFDIGPGDEVIVPAYSFMSTASTVALVGATPVFADVDPGSLNLDPGGIAALLTPATRAVIAVHLFGRAADMPAIRAALDAAGRPEVRIIEDAAQGLGARLDGRPVGTFADASCISFFPSKNFGAYGDGGMVFVPTEAQAAELRKLRQHGFAAKYNSEVLGYNARLDGIQAAILRAKLPDLEAVGEERRQNAARYRELFGRHRWPEGFSLPVDDGPGGRFHHVYNQFNLRVPRRDDLQKRLEADGIGTAIYYPRTLPGQPSLSRFAAGRAGWPNAEAATRDSLAIPIYPGLTDEQAAWVVHRIAAFYGAA
jgi:dTDP-4-amino-4,6-dideoxygalactose transaminase